jgi:ABC-2 type transport system ATP-binding protein
VGRGEVLGLLGPNGAGKDVGHQDAARPGASPTPARCSCSAGPRPTPAARARVGYLPELFRYQPWLSAAEVLRLHVRLSGAQVSAQEQRDCLALVGLGSAPATG